MITCDICDVQFEHRLELVEHQASLSHQIRVGVNLDKGERRVCPVCNFSCPELAEYSKHVDSDSHLTKLRALRSKRIAMVDSANPCMPFKKNSATRFESPAFYPANMQQPPPPLPPHISHTQPIQSGHFNSFFRPSIHTERPPQNLQNQYQKKISPHQHHQQPGPSNRQSIYKKDNRKNGQPNGGNGGSPMGKKKEEIKKKKGGVIAKVLASSAAIIKKKKEIVTTPKITSMDNKSKRYESLALKGAGMVMATNKSRTQVMMMERQVKYSLVERQAIEDGRGNGSFSSIPSITAPPPLPFSPPPHLNQRISSSSHNLSSFSPSSGSDASYAFCHPVHSTPHQLHDSNWPEFVRGINALHHDTPSSSTIGAPQQGQNALYMNGGGGMNLRKVKDELRDDDEIAVIPIPLRPIKQEPRTYQSPSDGCMQQQIDVKERKLNSDIDEQHRKLSVLSSRRAEMRRRFDEEMGKIDQEERREKITLATLQSTRASFRKDIGKVLQSYGS